MAMSGNDNCTSESQESTQGANFPNKTNTMIVNLDSSRNSYESDNIMGDFASADSTPVRFGRNLTNSSHSRRPALSKRKN